MSTRRKRIRGTKFHRVDTKGRVAIPAVWRDGFDSTVFMLPAKSFKVDTLKILTEAALDRYYEQVESMDWEPGKINAMIELLDSRVEELKLNEQGKLLIPKQVCEDQGFGGGDELALVGRGTHIEIFTTDAHKRMLAAEEAENADADKSLRMIGL